MAEFVKNGMLPCRRAKDEDDEIEHAESQEPTVQLQRSRGLVPGDSVEPEKSRRCGPGGPANFPRMHGKLRWKLVPMPPGIDVLVVDTLKKFMGE
jgi:hypothetical protein